MQLCAFNFNAKNDSNFKILLSYFVNIQIWIDFLHADMTEKKTSKQETSLLKSFRINLLPIRVTLPSWTCNCAPYCFQLQSKINSNTVFLLVKFGLLFSVLNCLKYNKVFFRNILS